MVVSGLPKPNEGRHIAEICSMALCVSMVVSGLPKPNEGRHIAEICSMALCVHGGEWAAETQRGTPHCRDLQYGSVCP